jgi:hypothetical protein
LLTCWWISAIPPSPICALASIFFSGSSRHLVLKVVTAAGMPRTARQEALPDVRAANAAPVPPLRQAYVRVLTNHAVIAVRGFTSLADRAQRS